METKREWTTIKEYEEILFDFYNGIARITINRERYRFYPDYDHGDERRLLHLPGTPGH